MKGNKFGGCFFCSEDEVAFVLAVMVVDNNNRFSCCNIFNGCFDVVEAYLCLVGHGIFLPFRLVVYEIWVLGVVRFGTLDSVPHILPAHLLLD